MQRGKTLSDNDAAARARNRQEEESLSLRLKHLELQQEHLHNNIEKERKTLLQTSRTTRRNSGCSPVVTPFSRRSSSPAIVSSHFRKPWALTTNETSHNVVYNDELDSYRCRRASIQVLRPTQTRFGTVLRSSKNGCTSAPPGNRQRSKSLVLPRPFTAHRRRNSPGSLQLESDDSVRTLVSDIDNPNKGQFSSELQLFNPDDESCKGIKQFKTAEKSQKRNLAWNEENGDLPMKSSFNSSTANSQNINSHDRVDEKSCVPPDEKQNTSEITNAFKDKYVHNNQVLLFKGKKIHHYVKPQDRYKRDPFKEVRQEKLIRKLSIENPIFLNGTRGNINIQTSFPRASRDRALRRLVEQNQEEIAAGRKPTVNTLDLQRRVREFCNS